MIPSVMKSASIALLFATLAAGCSSISLPSVPWSKSPPPPDPTAEALFQEGNRYYNEKRYVRALDAWQKLKSEHPFSPLLTETELKIADAYYLNKQYPEATAAFKEFQSMHPLNENIPFVLYRLGQIHFDQFTSTDRDQKNTEIAKTYFEKVIADHPRSPYAAEAKLKLAKAVEYLAEHQFNVAFFYFQQEKYPAAVDRFEEIVRKYPNTPTAVKSLFYLGESYRKEKNAVKATLAYEALLQHYPESQWAGEAKVQLAQIEKERHDPLALLLMRDRRPTAQPSSNGADSAVAKLKDLNLVAKKEVVYEEPGAEKSLFRRVVDKINPFSSSGTDKPASKQPETGIEMLTAKKAAEKEASPGWFAWLNPFSGRSAPGESAVSSKSDVVGQIDRSLKAAGTDPVSETAALEAPAANLPPVDAPESVKVEPTKLLSNIDRRLEEAGKNPAVLPPPPEIAEALKNPAVAQAAIAKTTAKAQPSESPVTSGLLANIDEKLKSRGLDPDKAAGASPDVGTGPREVPVPKKIELEPKLNIEKGPLFLNPAEISVPEKAASGDGEKKDPQAETAPAAPAGREIPRFVVRGPSQPRETDTNPAKGARTSLPASDDEPKSALEQFRSDMETIGKALNPFAW
ncbi:MAG TPA: outer membrane protein assembly factor BamD [candidate division Zixibacteria bacterium]|nr:outer membrane protein assembly factor BamD [candidate division Zixibacteria bacterium]